MTFRKKYSLFCWAAGTSLTRSGFELPPLPTGEIPAPWVFLGDCYRPGEGPLLLAINPGGARESQDDDPVYRAIKDFLATDVGGDVLLDAFEKVNREQRIALTTWPLWTCGLVPAVLETGRWTLDDVVLTNVVPFRTEALSDLKRPARDLGWTCLVRPALRIFKPPHIFALGKTVAGEEATSSLHAADVGDSKVWVLPRHRGDNGMHEGAAAVLAEARNHIRR